jgi:hypothetical protein
MFHVACAAPNSIGWRWTMADEVVKQSCHRHCLPVRLGLGGAAVAAQVVAHHQFAPPVSFAFRSKTLGSSNTTKLVFGGVGSFTKWTVVVPFVFVRKAWTADKLRKIEDLGSLLIVALTQAMFALRLLVFNAIASRSGFRSAVALSN